jgi:hypothetical protein
MPASTATYWHTCASIWAHNTHNEGIFSATITVKEVNHFSVCGILSHSSVTSHEVVGECCYIGIVTVRFVAKRTERCWSSGNEASSIKAMAVL